jgi:septum formation protein
VAPPLVLASRSPQRSAILEQLGIAFSVIPAGVEELDDGDPAATALENARRKARAVAALPAANRATVLGVDTIVQLDGRIYGKPADEAAARATLAALGGREHTVLSGLCAIPAAGGGEPRTAVATTGVTFRELPAAVLDWYLATEEWRERAGGYAIQGRGAALVQRIDGDYLNVVGLPVSALLELLPEILHGAGNS